MGYNILIVDDSATTRAIVRRTLAMANVPVDHCFEAADGTSALRLLATNKVDLVLADLHMPEMDGIEMARRILAEPSTRHIPVVVISAEPDVHVLADLRRQGVRGCIRKPFMPEQIRKVVNEVLEVTHA